MNAKTDLENELNAAEAELVRYSSALTGYRTFEESGVEAIKRMRAELAELEARVESLQRGNNVAQWVSVEMEGYRRMDEPLNDAVKRMRAELAAANQRIAELQARSRAWEETAEYCCAPNTPISADGVRSYIAELNAQLTAANEQIASMQAWRDFHSGERAVLEAQLAAANQRIAELEAQLAAANQRIAETEVSDWQGVAETAQQNWLRAAKRVQELKGVLRPFAAMDRPGCDLSEVACERGTASDLTVITSSDFRKAAEVLEGEFGD